MDTPVMTRSHYYNIRGLDYKVTTVCADGAVHFATRDICLGMGWKTIPASLGTYTDEVNRFVHDGKPYLDLEGVKALFNGRAGGDVFKKWVTLTLIDAAVGSRAGWNWRGGATRGRRRPHG